MMIIRVYWPFGKYRDRHILLFLSKGNDRIYVGENDGMEFNWFSRHLGFKSSTNVQNSKSCTLSTGQLFPIQVCFLFL